jgi:hypothetical protein
VDLDSWRLARDPIAAVQGKLLRVPKSPASADERACVWSHETSNQIASVDP